jgi:hypothetical protein
MKLTVEELEALERVRVLHLGTKNVEDRVDELGACASQCWTNCSSLTLSVVALGPVVSCSALAMDKGVRAEKVGEGARADEVHDSGLEVDLNRAGNVLGVAGLGEVDRD